MRSSVHSIVSNIKEAFAREKGRDRNNRLVIAEGEAEETIDHLRANFRTRRIAEKEYWPLHNLLVTVVKMLKSMLNS